MQNPDLFAKNNHSTAQHAKNYLESHQHLFQWNAHQEDVLEIGCANGRITKEVLLPFLDGRVREILAVDISESAIKSANKETFDNSKLRFETMNVEDKTIASKYKEKFGKIFAFLCFQMVHRDDLWSRNVYDMLQPKGQIFFTTLVNPCIYSKTLKSLKNDESSPYYPFIKDREDLFVDYGPKPIEKISKILENVGFRVDEINIKENRFVFPDKQHMINTFLGIEPYSKYIPEKLRESYNMEYIKRCMEYTNTTGGYPNYSFDVVHALATKM